MTRRSNRIGLYADVRAVLDEALASGGGTFTCADHGTAVHWRQRAYQFRKLFAETLGALRESPYDALLLRRVAPDDNVVRIEVRQSAGVFAPALVPQDVMVLDDDPLADIAAQLAAKIDRGEV